MRLSAPKKLTFWIALAIFVIGILLYFGILPIPSLKAYSFWGVAVSYVLAVPIYYHKKPLIFFIRSEFTGMVVKVYL